MTQVYKDQVIYGIKSKLKQIKIDLKNNRHN